MELHSNILVLATGNRGKVRELRELFGDLPLELKSLADFEGIVDVEETGSTFRDNAELKARGFALQTRQLSLADDSGLEIEALGNAPGIYSARFAGEDSGYDVKISKLLSMLDATGDTTRRARFVCVMSLADSDGRAVYSAEGICPGSIALEPRGNNGFGYDPIFIPDGFGSTFGELPDEVKKRISHRAKAAELIIRYLLDFIAV
ncbi:MAG TPA: RdgB/HAM1 family non-canonical purine NTP pyrophosphatase [Pyrinomonadaceae bacterium]|nr:RdgB/HAM1 family non-canonical purine NTP pyrophosphatase [Pyrinomonadaceae bacterium]